MQSQKTLGEGIIRYSSLYVATCFSYIFPPLKHESIATLKVLALYGPNGFLLVFISSIRKNNLIIFLSINLQRYKTFFNLIRNERQIYVFFTISDNLAVISVDHSCIPLVASILRPCGFLTSSCNFFAFYLLYNRKKGLSCCSR